MNEATVLEKTRALLLTEGVGGQAVVRLYTDAHSTLLGQAALQPFQRFTLDLGDFVLHPDLLGQLGDGETLLAVEGKGTADLVKGLAQAELYQLGVHLAFLAADAAVLSSALVGAARRKNVGVIAVADVARFVALPEAQLPLRTPSQFLSRQLETVVQLSGRQTFSFNIPTHYLVWATALQPQRLYTAAEARATLGSYPLPADWRSALAGAQKLGLVQVGGDGTVRLTPVGAASRVLLPATLDAWTAVHQVVGARGSGVPLAQYQPQAAAVLRLLLLGDPLVRLVIAGLERFPQREASFAALAAACDELDHARAPVFFLKPEASAALADARGRIVWAAVPAGAYRSATFYQYKSILKHAGILVATKLGGASVRGYDPTVDRWELA